MVRGLPGPVTLAVSPVYVQFKSLAWFWAIQERLLAVRFPKPVIAPLAALSVTLALPPAMMLPERLRLPVPPVPTVILISPPDAVTTSSPIATTRSSCSASVRLPNGPVMFAIKDVTFVVSVDDSAAVTLSTAPAMIPVPAVLVIAPFTAASVTLLFAPAVTLPLSRRLPSKPERLTEMFPLLVVRP